MGRGWSVPAVLLLAAIVCSGCDGSERQPSRGVVLVILDTVRADHLSSYGYERQTTPNLDRLAREGERYDEAFAQSSWTLPAVTSILTGQPPHTHGAGRSQGVNFPLRDGVKTLAERIAAAGYRTGAFISVIWCSRDSGLDRGFEYYDHQSTDASNRGQRIAAEATDAALAWLESLEGQPYFLVVHYFDPHLTYDPPAPYDTMFEPSEEGRIEKGFGSAGQVVGLRRGRLTLTPAQKRSLIARYDGELRYMDEQFGRLRAGLEDLGVWDDSLVVVVGDHGEEFWDHGAFEHGHSHYREMLRVPLIVRRPDGPAGQTISARVRQLDVAPTILDFAGIWTEGELPGAPLSEKGANYSVAEGNFWSGDLISVRSDEGTLIVDRSTGQRRYFAADDANESTILTADVPADLQRILDALPPRRTPDDLPWEPTEEQLDQLRALGYIQ